MKESLDKLIANLFGGLIFISVGLGAVAFVMFVIALVTGGTIGAAISINAQKLITFGIQMASLGVLCGLLKIYLGGKHYLTLKNESPEGAADADSQASLK
jgi:hypothetical protein